MLKALSAVLALSLWAGSALAQAPAPAQPIKSQNILNLLPDASTTPGYQNQTNEQRDRVQPGNNEIGRAHV